MTNEQIPRRLVEGKVNQDMTLIKDYRGMIDPALGKLSLPIEGHVQWVRNSKDNLAGVAPSQGWCSTAKRADTSKHCGSGPQSAGQLWTVR